MPNVVVRRPPFRKRGQPWFPLSDPAIKVVTGKGGVVLGGTAGAEFVHHQVDSDIVIEWDLDNDGDFDDPLEDVTSYVMALETKAGRDWASHLTGKAQPGQLRMTLLNRDGRFSYFNTDSPLTADPFSLRTGRMLRVRTAEATGVPPTLLIRDRFDRVDSGTLGTAETGQTWVNPIADVWQIVDGQAVPETSGDPSVDNVSIIDIGQADYYVQVVLPTLTKSGLGLVVRWADDDNYQSVTMSTASVSLVDVVGGVADTQDSVGFTRYPGLVLGVRVSGSDLTVYIDGVPVIEGTALNTSSQLAGLYASWLDIHVRPRLDDFEVWTDLHAATEGVLWTGDVSEVTPSVELGPFNTVTVSGEGWLARGATADVDPVRVVVSENTGHLVGNTLHRAGLLHPPGEIQEGDVQTGSVALDRGNALAIARLFEETEQGFLYEMNEGAIGFDSASARDLLVPVATFADTPGVQFGYNGISPLDHRREIVNRVTAGVAADPPDGISVTGDGNSTGAGVSNEVNVLLPTTAAGDLLVVVIVSTVANASVGWLTPLWWDVHRGTESDINTKVYSHWCDGTESNDTVQFYNDTTNSGGAWVAHIYRIQDWYEATAGLAISTFNQGLTPPQFDHGWGRYPTLFIAIAAGLTSSAGGTNTDPREPDGYSTVVTSTTNGANNGFDVTLMTAHKLDIVDAESAGAFQGPAGYLINESAVFAVRGYNGPHELNPTIKNPSQFGPSPGRFVTVNDVDSQDDHNMIRAHVNASNLFASETDAEDYANAVLDTYADDRPILSLTFPATISPAYRAQAVRRRVGDMVRVIANGDTALGIDADFFIENIGHRWSNGGKLWQTTWELSPAPE